MKITLVSDSCTTGWANWGHGELRLTPEHLVRIGRRDLTLKAAATGGARGGAVVAAGGIGLIAVEAISKKLAKPMTAPGTAIEVDRTRWEREITNQPKRTLLLPRDRIATVNYRQGMTTDRLRIVMTNGTRHTLLWLPNPHAKGLVGDAFHYQTDLP